jgi:hypothetical protein
MTSDKIVDMKLAEDVLKEVIEVAGIRPSDYEWTLDLVKDGIYRTIDKMKARI